ncbi:hypothetical protein HN51_027993, partial [Arachis hypogaea]
SSFLMPINIFESPINICKFFSHQRNQCWSVAIDASSTRFFFFFFDKSIFQRHHIDPVPPQQTSL